MLLAGGAFVLTRTQDVVAQSPTPKNYPATVTVQNFTPAGEKISWALALLKPARIHSRSR